MAYDPADQYVVLFGGYNSSAYTDTNDTWTYAHGNWTQLTTPTAPQPRRGASFAYDAASGHLVLFAGIPSSNACCFQDTWTFSGGNWTNITASSVNSSNTPPARYLTQLAYDAADHYVLLYGGCTSLGCASSLNDTWKLVDTNWTDISAASVRSPGARGGGMMLWDPLANSVFLYGGAIPAGIHVSDSWNFSGGNWTQISSPANPGPRGDAFMAFVPAYGYIVLFGGLYDSPLGGNGPISDTWLYLSTGWKNETANLTVMPSARWTFENAGTYDAKDGYPLLFGGRDPTGADLNDTWKLSWPLRATFLASRPGIDQNQSIDLITNASGGTFFYSYAYGGLPSGCVAQNSSSIHCTLNATGTFPINVTVTDTAGTRYVANLTIHVFPRPSVTFRVSPNLIDLGENVTYTANVSGGSGGINYTYLALPPSCVPRNASTFNCLPSPAGNYTSTVHVVDIAGVAASSAGATVTVNPRLAVTISTGPTAGIVPFTVNFSAQRNGGTPPVSYSWSFGDGSPNATGPNASHQFTSVGRYVAMVTVSDARALLATGRVAVNVLAPLVVAATVSATIGVAPLSVNFGVIPSGGASPYSYRWDFGDGTPPTSMADPVHVYSVAGSFNATVTLTDSGSRSTSQTVAILVYRPMSVAVSTNRTVGEVPLNVSFGATAFGGKGPFSYVWSFGDGASSALENTTHTFQTVGDLHVGLVVTDALGEQNRSSETLQVFPALSVAFVPSTVALALGQTVNFTAQTHGGYGAVGFVWSGLPPGCSAANHSRLSCVPNHVGNFTVSVVASDALGGRASANEQVGVGPALPTQGPSPTNPSAIALPWTWLLVGAVVLVVIVGLIAALWRSRRRRPPEESAASGETSGPNYDSGDGADENAQT
jgi:PKD repeat protein